MINARRQPRRDVRRQFRQTKSSLIEKVIPRPVAIASALARVPVAGTSMEVPCTAHTDPAPRPVGLVACATFLSWSVWFGWVFNPRPGPSRSRELCGQVAPLAANAARATCPPEGSRDEVRGRERAMPRGNRRSVDVLDPSPPIDAHPPSPPSPSPPSPSPSPSMMPMHRRRPRHDRGPHERPPIAAPEGGTWPGGTAVSSASRSWPAWSGATH